MSSILWALLVFVGLLILVRILSFEIPDTSGLSLVGKIIWTAIGVLVVFAVVWVRPVKKDAGDDQAQTTHGKNSPIITTGDNSRVTYTVANETAEDKRPRFRTLPSGSKLTQLPDKPELGRLITGFVVNMKNQGKLPAYDVRSSLAIFPQKMDLPVMGGNMASHANTIEPDEEYHHAENCLDRVSFDKQEALYAVFQMKYRDRYTGLEHTQVFYLKWNTPERLYKIPEFEGVSLEEKAKILAYLKKQNYIVLESTD